MAGRELCWAVTAIVATYAGVANAAGFAAARFGGELGNVTVSNPTALYFNPAGIALSSGTSVYLDGTLALRHLSWDHPGSGYEAPDPPGAEGANTGQASLFNVFGGPMAGVTTRLGNWAVGASLSVPFGGRAFWPQNDQFAGSTAYPLAADGVQRWHIIDGALTFIYGTIGVAYRFGPLSFGASANLVHSTVKNTMAKSFSADGTVDSNAEGRSALDVSGTQGSFGAGVVVEALPNALWIAASYQAQPGLGPMQLKGTLTLTYGAGGGPTPVTLDQALPDIWRWGARFRPSEVLELRLFGDFTRWSVMATQCVAAEGAVCAVDQTGAAVGAVFQNLRRKWKDTFAVHAGASYWVKPEIELFAGIAGETAATPDETLSPDLPDANNVAVGVGGRFEIARSLFLGASYTHIQYVNRNNIGKSQLPNALPPTKWPDGGGIYSQWIGVFNANLEKQF